MAKHYWYYTGIKIQDNNRINTLIGTERTEESCFDFALFHKQNGVGANLLMVQEIDEKQYNEIRKMFDDFNK